MSAWKFPHLPLKSNETAVRQGFSRMRMPSCRTSRLKCAAATSWPFSPMAASVEFTRSCRRACAIWQGTDDAMPGRSSILLRLSLRHNSRGVFPVTCSVGGGDRIHHRLSLFPNSIWSKYKSFCRRALLSANFSFPYGTLSTRFAISRSTSIGFAPKIVPAMRYRSMRSIKAVGSSKEPMSVPSWSIRSTSIRPDLLEHN